MAAEVPIYQIKESENVILRVGYPEAHLELDMTDDDDRLHVIRVAAGIREEIIHSA